MTSNASLINKFDEITVAANALGHSMKLDIRGEMSNGTTCSCGWKSKTYFENDDFARHDWLEHAKEMLSKVGFFMKIN